MIMFILQTPKVFMAFIFTKFSGTVIEEDVSMIDIRLAYRSNIKLNGTVEHVHRMGTIFDFAKMEKGFITELRAII